MTRDELIAELKRRGNARQRVLGALLEAEDRGVLASVLGDPKIGGLEARRRVRELRAAGCEIDMRQESPGLYRYILRGVPPGWFFHPETLATPEPEPLQLVSSDKHPQEDDGPAQPSLF